MEYVEPSANAASRTLSLFSAFILLVAYQHHSYIKTNEPCACTSAELI